MNGNDIKNLGFPPGKSIGMALKAAQIAREDGLTEAEILHALKVLCDAPGEYLANPVYKPLAQYLLNISDEAARFSLDSYAPYKIWGKNGIDPGAIAQIERAVRLPVSVRGALMPDAHQGYGLPIGGVLATYNSVIPYAVGVDIACRMRMTIFGAAPHTMEQKREKFRKILENNTVFGTGETWATPRDHEVMDDPLWREHPVARQFRDTAWKQLGTSGSGNHFVEFGSVEVTTAFKTPGGMVEPGKYLALLSHSGSRRLGYEIANYYTEIAMNRWQALPKDYVHLSWLDLDSGPGAEYWAGMDLAGRYACANHAVIHDQIADAVRFPVIGSMENHHNFAWKEMVDGQEVIVHRKGATPAGEGVIGVIPGSMGSPGYVVRGLGNPDSLSSAAHGAGRKMSRSEAFGRFNWEAIKRKLKQQGIEVLSAGLDEVPGVYKDIRQVMADQSDLVEPLAEFQPKMVKMDHGSGKRGTFRED